MKWFLWSRMLLNKNEWILKLKFLFVFKFYFIIDKNACLRGHKRIRTKDKLVLILKNISHKNNIPCTILYWSIRFLKSVFFYRTWENHFTQKFTKTAQLKSMNSTGQFLGIFGSNDFPKYVLKKQTLKCMGIQH